MSIYFNISHLIYFQFKTIKYLSNFSQHLSYLTVIYNFIKITHRVYGNKNDGL
jgi:hypothetical protein